MKTNDWQLLRVVKVGIAFHFICLTSSPSVLKLWSSVSLRQITEVTGKTNKQELGKKIPEPQEQVLVNAVYLISAKRKRYCKSVLFFPSQRKACAVHRAATAPGPWGHVGTVILKDPKSFLYSAKFLRICTQSIFQYICKIVDISLNNLCHSILYTSAGGLSSFSSVIWNKYLYFNSIVLPYILKQIGKFLNIYIYLRHHQMCLGWWVGEAHLLSIFCNINAYIFVAEEKKRWLQQIKTAPHPQALLMYINCPAPGRCTR